ncbi:MAG TPA: hypothetical protein PLP17_10585, partial [Oligoflexia bacterium]|nr:hypothetical protein [Oligoflexia bacterium]
MYRRYALRIIMVLSVAGGLALASAFMVFKEKQDRCWASIGEKVSKSNDLTAVLHQEIGEFQLLVEESLVARTKILSVIN